MTNHQRGLPEVLTDKRFHCVKCNLDFFFDDFIEHMDNVHLDVSYHPCSNCEDGIHNQCPCPCFCPCIGDTI